ncbi:MAG TPA: histidine kinase [Cyclobacteriaceae bacterium]|nr:histidine kinase [Cyclobacteriaceae bacterium]
MTVRFTRDRVILYLSITVVFVIHWMYNDPISDTDSFLVSLLGNIWIVIYVVGLNILYFEYALPFVTSVKVNRVVAIVLSIAVHFMVFAIGLYGWRELGMLFHVYTSYRSSTGSGAAFLSALRFTPGVFLLFAVFKLFFDYTQLKYEGQQIRIEKKQAELLFLKSQINPHFLFNTLNNIYSLSQYQPQLVSEAVLRLSKILRYLLYETGNQFITIEKEIKILTDYIDLEKLRYSNTVPIEFQHDVEDPSQMIPPLLLIPLVENAFKHGVSISRGNRFVDVKCIVSEQKLHFVVKNSSYSGSDYEETKDNIGLSNLKRRLDLLYKDFELGTEQKDSTFTAVLKINLASHV